MHQNLLQKLWLSPQESTIYLTLLSHPNISLSKISQYTHINRPQLYKILPRLKESGLISEVLYGKRTLFQASHPKILQTYLSNIIQDYDIGIPQIEQLYQSSSNHPIFKHFSGKIGIKYIFLDIGNTLQKWDVFYRYSSRRDIETTSIAPKDYLPYKSLREEKQLQRYVITNQYLQSKKPNRLDKDVVIIPPEFDDFEDNITKIIYANKVAIIDYNSYESFVIESQIFANFEKKLFQLLFKFLKNKKRG